MLDKLIHRILVWSGLKTRMGSSYYYNYYAQFKEYCFVRFYDYKVVLDNAQKRERKTDMSLSLIDGLPFEELSRGHVRKLFGTPRERIVRKKLGVVIEFYKMYLHGKAVRLQVHYQSNQAFFYRFSLQNAVQDQDFKSVILSTICQKYLGDLEFDTDTMSIVDEFGHILSVDNSFQLDVNYINPNALFFQSMDSRIHEMSFAKGGHRTAKHMALSNF